MKKQNNILAYIAKITYSVALIASLSACADEDVIKNNYIEEGIPVELSMDFASPEMVSQSTRGLNDYQENIVNNLYIVIFNKNGSAKKAGSGLYKPDGKSITIKTTSGESLIYGIANASTNQQENLIAKLDLVENIEDLNECFITTTVENGIINVDRISPNLVMSGAYMAKKIDNTKDAGYCAIYPQTTTLDGLLKLIHLDSRIKFNIYTGGDVTKIEPKEWQVLNVPVQSFLFERSSTPKVNYETTYARSVIHNNQLIYKEKDSNGKEMHTFSFYQFENFKNAKPEFDKFNTNPDEGAKNREKEVKTSEGKNKGEFAYVEPNATYVQFKAYLELTKKGTNNGTNDTHRIADVQVTVLLGGKDPGGNYDFKNFNTWRNKRYTYNVTINNVTDIITEVQVDDDSEPRPGIEGDVIDAQDQVRILDAHYNCFNIALTAKQVDNMSILVYTPFDKVKYNTETDKDLNEPKEGTNRDYKWIKFKYLGKKAEYENAKDYMPLAKYVDPLGGTSTMPDDDAGNGRMDIYSLRKDVIAKSGGNSESTEELYYTVFIDEYYYDKVPNGKPWDTTKPLWVNFVNEEDRYIMLVYSPDESKDQESSYSSARYFIKQKSIQTYYSTKNLTNDETALGMEHVNETRFPVWDDKSSAKHNPDNGYKNCANYIKDQGNTWSNYTLKNTSYAGFDYIISIKDDKNTFELSTHKINALCLSRNRDKNGNGKIDPEEMEWYVPTYKQLSGMYLGANSLPSPLFTPLSSNESADIAFEGNYGKNKLNYHFMTSDHDKIWAEEGCSNKGLSIELGNEYAYEMRCVRNLGIKDYTKVPEKPYTGRLVNGNWRFNMSQMEESNLRSKVVNTKLAFHANFKSTRNRPYKSFELAKYFYEPSKLEHQKNAYTFYNKGEEDMCSYYTEDADKKDKGSWRTPNQRELLIIYNIVPWPASIMKTGGYGMYSCTHWEYSKTPDYRIFAFHPQDDHMFLAAAIIDYKAILRCVRDID